MHPKIDKFINYWKRDKFLSSLEVIGYSIIIACNIFLITRPLPIAEIAFYIIIANLVGFGIGASIVKPILLGTIFKKRFDKMIENIIKIAKNGKN